MSAITGVGIDFGTTNSVVALAHADGHVESLRFPSIEGPTATFRTALTFWREGRKVAHVAGPEAIARAESPTQAGLDRLKAQLVEQLAASGIAAPEGF